jgi:predicted DNA-binding transcriptional regulator YafY
MRFVPEAALLALDDRAFWDTVDEQPDGSVIVAFAVPSLRSALRQVLQYGPRVKVIDPPELCALVIEQSQAVAALYE